MAAANLISSAIKPIASKEEFIKAVRHGVEVSERYMALNPDDALALSRTAVGLIELGETEKGLERAEHAYAINPHVCRYNVACANILGGRAERALDLLEEHARANVVMLDWLEKDGDWDAARDHPRFIAITESLRTAKKSH